MIKYQNNHSSLFTKQIPPFMIAVMQFSAAMYTEIVNLLLICGSNTVYAIIINFIALWVIADIDD